MAKTTEILKKEWSDHKGWIIFAGVLLLAIVYYVAWKKPWVKVVPFTPQPQIKEVIRWKIKTVQVPIETGKVTVLNKEDVIKHVPGLPDSFKNDPKQQVTSTAELKPSEAGWAVMNFIDTGKGTSEIYAKERALPFMAFQSKGKAGARGGYSDFGKEVDGYYQNNFARIGGFEVYGYVEVSGRERAKDPLGYKVMLGVEHKF